MKLCFIHLRISKRWEGSSQVLDGFSLHFYLWDGQERSVNSCSLFLEELLVIQAQEQEELEHRIYVWHCHCLFRMSLSSWNHYIWLMPVIDNNLSVSWKSPDYRVWLCLLPLVSPKPAGWTWLHVPLHAASQFNLLSSTNWTALLWKQFSAPPLLGLGVNIPDKIFGSQSVIFFWSSVLACFSITAFPKCFVSLLVMAAAGHSSRLWYELPSWSGILQQSAFLKADWCCLNPFWVGVMHPTGCLALLMKCWIQSL